MKKILFSLGLGILALSLAGSALAAEVLAPSHEDPNISVGASEQHKNLYTAGANVIVNGPTKGDLTVAGGIVTVAGDVEQELLMAGGTLNLNGSVGGTARVAGGTVIITAPVGGDLVVAGGNLVITSKSEVGGDLLIAGGNITIDAPVKGSVRLMGGMATINSKISGDVIAQTKQALEFGPGAVVTGTVYYKGPDKAVVDSGAQVPNMQYTFWNPMTGRGMLAGILTLGFLLQLLATLATAFLLAAFKKSWILGVADKARTKPWASLGWGLVYFIVMPAAAILLFVTLVGFYASFIVGVIYVLLLLLAKIFAVITAGYLVMGWIAKTGHNVPIWQPVVLGTVIWYILAIIPFLGWAALIVLFLVSFGAMVNTMVASLKEQS